MSLERIQAAMAEGMTPNALDRAISMAFPGWAVRRMQARATMAVGGAFFGARRDRPATQNWNPLLQSQDDELPWWDRAALVARSADLEKNDPTAGGIIAELVTSVIGTGMSLHLEPKRRILNWSESQAADWAQDVQERFELWAENPNECDLARKRNFYQSQAIAYATTATRGDAFALMPNKIHPGGIWGTKVQLLEGDRCLTPVGMSESDTLRQGVETDEFGAPVRYYFAKKNPRGIWQLKPEDFMPPVNAFDAQGNRRVLHLMREKRLDMRRGYPVLAPIIEPLKQMSRLSEAELAASVVSSFFAVVIKKNGSGSSPLGPLKQGSGGSSFVELGPAIVAELNPGEEIQNVAPQRPNGAFDPFWRSLMGQVSLRTQIPPEVLLKKFESSYTAARGALLQFWKFVTIERDTFVGSNFCSPVFETWLAEDVAAGRTKAPGFFKDPLLRYAYSHCRWIGDNAPILDPLKEVMAAQELINYGLSTYEEQTMRLTGGNFDDNTDRLSREVGRREAAGLISKPPADKPSTKPGTEQVEPGTDDPTDDSEDDGAEPQQPFQPRSMGRAALLAFAMKGSE